MKGLNTHSVLLHSLTGHWQYVLAAHLDSIANDPKPSDLQKLQQEHRGTTRANPSVFTPKIPYSGYCKLSLHTELMNVAPPEHFNTFQVLPVLALKKKNPKHHYRFEYFPTAQPTLLGCAAGEAKEQLSPTTFSLVS